MRILTHKVCEMEEFPSCDECGIGNIHIATLRFYNMLLNFLKK